MKLCKCLARQGVWIIARTVKTQPLLKITSGMSERATLREGGREEKRGMGNDPSSVASPANAHTDARDRAHFHVFLRCDRHQSFSELPALTILHLARRMSDSYFRVNFILTIFGT